MLKNIIPILLSFAVVNILGCQDMSKQDVGTISGATVGGILGSTIGQGSGQALATGAGILAGAFIGGSIGMNMDETDKLKLEHTLEKNPIGEPSYWKNQQNGKSYTVVPTRNVNIDGNPYCREYRSTAKIAGQKQQIYGTACRQPDGTWQVQQ